MYPVGMPKGTWTLYFLPLLLVLLSGFLNGLEVEGTVVQCYVCSWQKPTQNFSVADNCTHHHFKPEYASIVNCSSGGCEAVTYRHSKSDDVYHFSRNCVNSKNGLSHGVDRCFNVEGKFDYTSRCECHHSDLCNASPSTITTAFTEVIMLGAIAIMVMILK